MKSTHESSHIPSLGEDKHGKPLRKPWEGLLWISGGLTAAAIISATLLAIRFESPTFIVIGLLLFLGAIGCSVAYQIWSWRYDDDRSDGALIAGIVIVIIFVMILVLRGIAG